MSRAVGAGALAQKAGEAGLSGALVRELASPNHERRAGACATLGELLEGGELGVSPVLIEALGDSHPAVRATAAEALSRGRPDAIEAALLDALRQLGGSPRPGHRASVVHALGQLDRPADGALAEALVVEAERADQDVRFQAVASLNRLGCGLDSFREAVGRLVRDPDAEVAAIAAIAAADLEEHALRPMIVERWAEARGFAKRHLALAAAHLGSDAVVDTLLRAMRDGIDALDAVDALVVLATEPARETLYRAARSWRAHPIIRARAAVGLLEVEHPEGPALVEKQLAHRRDDVRWSTLEWLGRTSRREWRPTLEGRLTDRGSPDSATAAHALLLLGDPAALPALRAAAESDPRGEVRAEAAAAVNALEALTTGSGPARDRDAAEAGAELEGERKAAP